MADLVSKWGGAWWGENVNKMDGLYTHPHTGTVENQPRQPSSPASTVGDERHEIKLCFSPLDSFLDNANLHFFLFFDFSLHFLCFYLEDGLQKPKLSPDKGGGVKKSRVFPT